jgi:hypothetical protein
MNGHERAVRERRISATRRPAVACSCRSLIRSAAAALDGPGDAKVNHPGAVLGQQHVGRLEVAVYNARGVDRA